MKATELIALLQAAVAEHGDHHVCVAFDSLLGEEDVSGVSFDPDIYGDDDAKGVIYIDGDPLDGNG